MGAMDPIPVGIRLDGWVTLTWGWLWYYIHNNFKFQKNISTYTQPTKFNVKLTFISGESDSYYKAGGRKVLTMMLPFAKCSKLQIISKVDGESAYHLNSQPVRFFLVWIRNSMAMYLLQLETAWACTYLCEQV